jgi:anaerobic nitric oxide reductase transcription regulator
MAGHKERPRIVTLEPHNLDLEEQALEPLPSAPAHEAPLGRPGANMKTLMGEYQKRLINESLARNQDKWADVARDLGIDRANLNRLAKRLGLF